MSDDENIDDLKAKLEEREQQFQSYKEECKQIESMLEEESVKKQEEIKQLKEEAIKKEKSQKMMTIQISQLEAEVQNLKAAAAESNKNDEASEKNLQEMAKLQNNVQELEAKIATLENKNAELLGQIEEFKTNNQAMTEELGSLKQKQQESSTQMGNGKSDQKELSALKEKVKELQEKGEKQSEQLKKKQSSIANIEKEYEEKLKKAQAAHSEAKSAQKEEQKERRYSTASGPSQAHFEKEISKQKELVAKLEQKCEKAEKLEKQLRTLIKSLETEKSRLSEKVKVQNRQLAKKSQQQIESESPSYQSPQKQTEQIVIADSDFSALCFSCLLLTKRHYVSPFLEAKDKQLKLYKNTKTGFEKSLGATRHKFDWVGYDSAGLVGSSVARVTQDEENSHTIIVYGAKRTGKKYLMAEIVSRLREFLEAKIDESSEEVRAVFMKRSPDEEKNYLKETTSKDEVASVFEEVISMGEKSPDQKHSSKKNSKPKVRYFGLTVGMQTWEVITSSWLNPFIKNNETFSDYLNNIAFGKLSDVLQSTVANYQIITTLNPIVSLYEECKNTLSITLVPHREPAATPKNDWKEWAASDSPSHINREDLSELTKKKLDSFEKESEQSSLKLRRYEQECNFYRAKFEDLEVRIKNLINTHHEKNSYLKKSPVVLSYEKLLKFVLSVLTRNNSINPKSATVSPSRQNDSNNIHIEEYIEEDAKSIDGF